MMNPKSPGSSRFRQVVVAGALLLMTLAADAQDLPDPAIKALALALGTRTSPYDPPTPEGLVTESEPGLDTGCTYNTDPEHPLLIEILIDRYVGEVDAKGFLINPAPLIAQGIIPATLEIILPAYDVDVKGWLSPEPDEVFFNGTKLGLLTGDNETWKLNTFRVDITQVKFPTQPLADSLPTPVINTVQIQIDRLNGHWCTAIDWVALVIPIRPKFTLRLAPQQGHNPIRQDNSETTIDVIYQDSAAADCQLTNNIGAYDEYPFSGPSRIGSDVGQATLHTQITPCPEGSLSLPLAVAVNWKILGTARQGHTTWSGYQGDVVIKMPDSVGIYSVELKYSVNGSTLKNLSRKLLVTQTVPALSLPPRRSWYEKATTWAAGEKDSEAILKKLLGSMYVFGGTHWRYGYCMNTSWLDILCWPEKCNWNELVADPLTCNYADCHVFSEVFENIANILGIKDFDPSKPAGAHGLGFVTHSKPSLDPAFPGNARPLGGSDYDRYRFDNHSLRKKFNQYYDATFNGIYSSETEFIAYNLNGKGGVDAKGSYLETDEGSKVYPMGLMPSPYHRWKKYEYTTPLLPSPAPQMTPPSAQATDTHTKSTDIQFRATTFSTLDDDEDGLAEAILAVVEVEILREGEYVFTGSLNKAGQVIALNPFFETAMSSDSVLNKGPGIYTTFLRFSGEQIFRSGQNGPYELELAVIFRRNSVVAPPTFTEPYDYKQFGELGGSIKSITNVARDTNGNGKFDGVETTVTLEIRRAGDYHLEVDLIAKNKEETPIVGARNSFALKPGTPTLKLLLPGKKIRRSGLDGPYRGVVNLIEETYTPKLPLPGIDIWRKSLNISYQDAVNLIKARTQKIQKTVDQSRFVTPAYLSKTFEVLLELDGTFNEQGIDTNGNGLFDILRLRVGVDVTQAGTFRVSSTLNNPISQSIFNETVMNLATGLQTLTFDFAGTEIRRQLMDGRAL